MYQAILTRVSFFLQISNDVVQQELEEYQDMGGNSGGNDGGGGGKLIVHVLTITIFDNYYFWQLLCLTIHTFNN